MRILGLITILFSLYCCSNELSVAEVQKRADSLLDKIAKGEASNEFPEEYFPSQQRESILYDLANKCDFKNRKGGFVNDYYKKGINQIDLISLSTVTNA